MYFFTQERIANAIQQFEDGDITQEEFNLDITAARLGMLRYQVRNLYRLAVYLYELPETYEHFGMAHYFVQKFGDGPSYELLSIQPCRVDTVCRTPEAAVNHNECGASACAIGHSLSVPNMEIPVAGLLYDFNRTIGALQDTNLYGHGISWGGISELLLGTNDNAESMHRSTFIEQAYEYHLGSFLFSSYHSIYDDTAKGAARRIIYVLSLLASNKPESLEKLNPLAYGNIQGIYSEVLEEDWENLTLEDLPKFPNFPENGGMKDKDCVSIEHCLANKEYYDNLLEEVCDAES